MPTPVAILAPNPLCPSMLMCNMHCAQVGDRVFFWQPEASGAFAEKALVDEDHLAPLSNALDFAQGAALPIPYFTAFRALKQLYLIHTFHRIHYACYSD